MARVVKTYGDIDTDEHGEEARRQRQALTRSGAGLMPYQPDSIGDTSAPVGRFVNFGHYFSLNADKANAMAKNLGGSVERGQEDARKGISDASNRFNSAAQAGTLAYNAPSIAPTTGKFQGNQPSQARQQTWAGLFSQKQQRGQAYKGKPQQEYANAPKPSNNAPQTNDETKQLATSKYTGPDSLESQSGYDELTANARRADERAKQLDNGDTGLQSLLADEYGALGGYGTPMGAESTGKSRLDAGLAGVAGRPMFKNISDYFKQNTAAGALGNAVATSKTRAAQGRTETEDAARRYGEDAAKYDEANQAKEPKTLDAMPGAVDNEIGWTDDPDDTRYLSEQEQIGMGFSLDQARDPGFWGFTNPGGYTEQEMRLAAYVDASDGSDPRATASAVMTAINEDDWSAFQEAARKGPSAVRAWVAAMRKKYGI